MPNIVVQEVEPLTEHYTFCILKHIFYGNIRLFHYDCGTYAIERDVISKLHCKNPREKLRKYCKYISLKDLLQIQQKYSSGNIHILEKMHPQTIVIDTWGMAHFWQYTRTKTIRPFLKWFSDIIIEFMCLMKPRYCKIPLTESDIIFNAKQDLHSLEYIEKLKIIV